VSYRTLENQGLEALTQCMTAGQRVARGRRELTSVVMPELDTYNRRRDFTRTPEPRGTRVAIEKHRPRFVIQAHAGRRLHYDFRLEIGGVLVSWLVRKGPSLDPHDKRFAVRTEDHPIEYGDFEGVIPEGYGAGTVLLWDAGTFENLGEHDLEQALDVGHLVVELQGAKLEGAFALTRLRDSPRESWLLVKLSDKNADSHRDPIASEFRSVKSGRTLDEIARSG
jgi:DNA ligase D-like protein (predicted 3'-phosphoesterase)